MDAFAWIMLFLSVMAGIGAFWTWRSNKNTKETTRPTDDQIINSGENAMSLHLYIPDSIAQAIRMPENRLEPQLCTELAVALYSQGFLSFGKARELAGMGKYEFGQLLGKREIVRHYGSDELKDDLCYARSK